MTPAALRRDRRGMTLSELLIALVLSGLIILPAMTFLGQQQLAYALGTSRMMVTQNHRFALGTLERSIRTAGSGIPLPGVQPWIVFAGTDAMAFNADYASNQATDLTAVYVDTAASAEEVDALPPARRITIPGSSFMYPDTTYTMGSGNSLAETILFSFTADASTPRTDDFVLRRQVNDLAPEVVARGILRTPGRPFFEYQELVTPATGPSTISVVPSTVMPLTHAARAHGGPADTMGVARIDAIRAVRVSFTVTSGQTNSREQRRSVSRLIRMPNAGVALQQTCGEAPQGPGSPTATVVDPGGGNPRYVSVTWNASADELTGEHDVLRYVLWRRAAGATTAGDPIASVSTGSASYVFADYEATPGATWSYELAAQDCTPALSTVVSTAQVTP